MSDKWNIGKLNKGKHLPVSHRDKISNTKKQQYISGKLKLPDNTGKTPWNIGQSWSEEICKKISLAKKGKAPWNVGVPRTEQEKRKISLARKGMPAWNKGIARSREAKKSISRAMRKLWKERKKII